MQAFELQGGFGIDKLALVEGARPQPGPGQVLVKMRAWSLNYRDLMVVTGTYNPNLKLPVTPLSDGMGEVAELGEGVTRVSVGQRVAGTFMQGWVDGELTEAKANTALGAAIPGVAAEYVVYEADGVVPLPDYLTDEEAATLPCAALTAWHALVTKGNICDGDTVLVQGTGGVSLFALQFARLYGARVIATSSSDEKLARVLAMGAEHGVNYKAIPNWGDRARELTGKKGVDHVVEVGGGGTLAQSLRAVKTGGRISLIGVLSGAGQVDPVRILMKSVCVQGIFVGSRAMFVTMNEFIDQHKLRPVIDRVFPFQELPQALTHLASGAHFGKIALRI